MPRLQEVDAVGRGTCFEASFPEARHSAEEDKTVYEKYVKRLIDIVLSGLGMLLFSWLYLLLFFAVYLDDPGPVLFKQKRFGKHKCFFILHKFRSMKMDTPHDMPTHSLKNPERYLTRVGKFLRRSSLDEIPQLWDIFIGKMSIVGPRPVLWKETDLIDERDKYGANDVLPGLTGWAQINGRDMLDITEKAKMDGEYVRHLHAGGGRAFLFDCRCFFGSFSPVARGDGVIEGDLREERKKKLAG